MNLNDFEIQAFKNKTLSQIMIISINRRMIICVTALFIAAILFQFSVIECGIAAGISFIVGFFWALRDYKRYQIWKKKYDDHQNKWNAWKRDNKK